MAGNGDELSGRVLAGMIDHTLLRPEATQVQIRLLCAEALEHGFAAVCVSGAWVGLAADLVAGSDVAVAAVAGFPLGSGTSRSKAFEAADAVQHGAAEVDVMINVGALKDGDDSLVGGEIREVVRAAGEARVKVILETALLSDPEKVRACDLARDAGAAFVKTSTGFGPGGATEEDVALLRRTVGLELGVKAAGGIRTRARAVAMIRAGANRLGTSSSVRIVSGD